MQDAEDIWTIRRETTRLTRLAEYLGVSRQAVSQWTRVPEEHHIFVARWLGVAPRDLRPDLYPQED